MFHEFQCQSHPRGIGILLRKERKGRVISERREQQLSYEAFLEQVTAVEEGGVVRRWKGQERIWKSQLLAQPH